MTFDQPLASANAPWTRTMDGFGGAARATAARGSMASRSNLIFPPSVSAGTGTLNSAEGGRSITPRPFLSSALPSERPPTVSRNTQPARLDELRVHLGPRGSARFGFSARLGALGFRAREMRQPPSESPSGVGPPPGVEPA